MRWRRDGRTLLDSESHCRSTSSTLSDLKSSVSEKVKQRPCKSSLLHANSVWLQPMVAGRYNRANTNSMSAVTNCQTILESFCPFALKAPMCSSPNDFGLCDSQPVNRSLTIVVQHARRRWSSDARDGAEKQMFRRQGLLPCFVLRMCSVSRNRQCAGQPPG